MMYPPYRYKVLYSIERFQETEKKKESVNVHRKLSVLAVMTPNMAQ